MDPRSAAGRRAARATRQRAIGTFPPTGVTGAGRGLPPSGSRLAQSRLQCTPMSVITVKTDIVITTTIDSSEGFYTRMISRGLRSNPPKAGVMVFSLLMRKLESRRSR